MTATPASWEIWGDRECLAHVGSLNTARQACVVDAGRTLTIYDPLGTIAALHCDGRDVTENESSAADVEVNA